MGHHGIPDNLQLTVPNQETQEAVRKKHKRIHKIIMLAIILFILGILISCGLFLKGFTPLREIQEHMESGFEFFVDAMLYDPDEIEFVLQKFMDAMAEKDIEAAAEYLTKDAINDRQDEFEAMIKEGNYLLFTNYTSLNLTNLEFIQNPNNPTSVADVVFEIVYEDGSRAIFTAVLEKWDDIWKIESLQLDHFVGLSAST